MYVVKVLFGSFVVGGKQAGGRERKRETRGREREKRERGKQEGEREKEGRRETRGREREREKEGNKRERERKRGKEGNKRERRKEGRGLSCITSHTFLLGASIPIFAHTIHLTTGLSFQRLPLTV